MTLADIFITVAAFWFAVYMAAVLAVFGLPNSISETHYLWKGKWPKWAGKFVFPGWLSVFVLLILPSVLAKTAGSDWQFVAFLMLASLLFVAASPCFRGNDCGSRTHFAGAYMSAAFGITYCIIFGDWRFPAMVAVLAAGAIIHDKARYVLYLEMAAFIGVICCVML